MYYLYVHLHSHTCAWIIFLFFLRGVTHTVGREKQTVADLSLKMSFHTSLNSHILLLLCVKSLCFLFFYLCLITSHSELLIVVVVLSV